MGIGQYWEDLVTTADVVLPMVYPSHYMRGVYNLKHPNSEPYQVIRRAMQDALAPLGPARRRRAEIRPYLQAFTLGQPRYTPAHGAGADPRLGGAGARSLGALEPAQRLRPGDLPARETASVSVGLAQPAVPIRDELTFRSPALHLTPGAPAMRSPGNH